MFNLRKTLCAVLAAIVMVSTLCPALAANVQAKVNSGDAHFYQYATTSSKNVPIGKGVKVYVSADKGDWARVTCNGIVGYMKKGDLKKAESWKDKVIRMDWFHYGQYVLGDGEYGTLYDIYSGKTIRIKRMGGSYHADVEPATTSDTKKLKAIGSSWECRPAILYSNGYFVACSFNTMPHGSQTINDNGFNGQFCVHLLNSKTHGSEAVNKSHQEALRFAYYWAHPD